MIGETPRVHLGDCLDLMRSLPPNSVDAIVCDPPYGLSPDGRSRTWDELAALRAEGRGPRGGFMGQAWDAGVPGVTWARECLRVLKPGGHLIAFASTRTVHRLAVAVEDAGLQIRDQLGWVYWNGFPKSTNISKAIDRRAGVSELREVVGSRSAGIAVPGEGPRHTIGGSKSVEVDITIGYTPEARRWDGWGTALKPTIEPAVFARKSPGATLVDSVLEWEVGPLNVDGCRFLPGDIGWIGPNEEREIHDPDSPPVWSGFAGRFPSNLYHCPKPSRRERERGTRDLPSRSGAEAVQRKEGTAGMDNPRAGAGRTASEVRNFHPTVKPVRLMRWLGRLVTPPGGLILDPFCGSGTMGIAAVLEGFRYLGAEMTPEYHRIAEARIAHAVRRPGMWSDTKPGPPKPGSKPVEVDPAQIDMFGG